MVRQDTGVDGGFAENLRFFPADGSVLFLDFVFDGAKQGKLVVVRKDEDIPFAVNGAVLFDKAVVYLIQDRLLFL